MTRQIVLILMLIILSHANAQEIPYKFSKDIIAQIDEKQNAFALQLAATDFAFKGDYSHALKTWNQQRPNQKELVLNAYDSAFFHNSTAVSAKEYIIERSKKEEIIILNELHHNPSHRVFASSLLKELYENGYRYLGLEALIDIEINDRKFPTLESGFYTAEPEFGNFIKQALDLGFIIFGYESTQEANWDTDNWKNREIGQAQNIYRFMQNHKDGKYFIYCGAGHAFEGNNNGRGLSMAGVLTDLTKINPFKIDQNRYSDKGEDRYNNPLSKLVVNNTHSVLINAEGEVFRGNPSSYETDISIIQSVNSFKTSLWSEELERKELRIPKDKIPSYPALVLVYRKGEYTKNGIPTAVIELNLEDDDSKKIYLKDGDYEIVVLNSSYEVIYSLQCY